MKEALLIVLAFVCCAVIFAVLVQREIARVLDLMEEEE